MISKSLSRANPLYLDILLPLTFGAIALYVSLNWLPELLLPSWAPSGKVLALLWLSRFLLLGVVYHYLGAEPTSRPRAVIVLLSLYCLLILPLTSVIGLGLISILAPMCLLMLTIAVIFYLREAHPYLALILVPLFAIVVFTTILSVDVYLR